MKILVIGGTSGIGLQVVEQALARGYTVTVLARRPEKLRLSNENLRVEPGDVRDPAVVDAVVRGQDAVVLSLGVKTIKRVSVFSEGTKNTLASMKANGVKRLIAVTGIGAGDSRGHGGFIYDKIFFPLLLKRVYEDKDRQEELIKASGLDWVIVRPGFLTNRPATGRYQAKTELRGALGGWISRADVARFILEQVLSSDYINQAPLLIS